jgi:hypothetical protein
MQNNYRESEKLSRKSKGFRLLDTNNLRKQTRIFRQKLKLGQISLLNKRKFSISKRPNF